MICLNFWRLLFLVVNSSKKKITFYYPFGWCIRLTFLRMTVKMPICPWKILSKGQIEMDIWTIKLIFWLGMKACLFEECSALTPALSLALSLAQSSAPSSALSALYFSSFISFEWCIRIAFVRMPVTVLMLICWWNILSKGQREMVIWTIIYMLWTKACSFGGCSTLTSALLSALCQHFLWHYCCHFHQLWMMY